MAGREVEFAVGFLAIAVEVVDLYIEVAVVGCRETIAELACGFKVDTSLRRVAETALPLVAKGVGLVL